MVDPAASGLAAAPCGWIDSSTDLLIDDEALRVDDRSVLVVYADKAHHRRQPTPARLNLFTLLDIGQRCSK